MPGPYETQGTALGRAADDRIAQLLSAGLAASDEVARLTAEVARLQALLDADPGPVPTGLVTGASTALAIPGHDRVPWARTYLQDAEQPDDYTKDAGVLRAVQRATTGVVLSFKAAPGPWLAFLVRSITALGLEVIVTYNHEPENDGKTPAEVAAYHTAWTLTLTVVGDLPKVRTATILMGARTEVEWDTYFHAGVDLCGFDRYNPGIQTAKAYVPPDEVFGKVVAYAAKVGLPLLIGETGTNIVGTDANGRATWAADARAYLDDAGCVIACWWHQGKCAMDAATADAWLS